MQFFFVVSICWAGRQNQAPRLFRVDVAPNVRSARHWMDGTEAASEVCHAHGPAPQSFSQQFLTLPCFLLGGGTRSVLVGWGWACHYDFLATWPSQIEWQRSYKESYWSYPREIAIGMPGWNCQLSVRKINSQRFNHSTLYLSQHSRLRCMRTLWSCHRHLDWLISWQDIHC